MSARPCLIVGMMTSLGLLAGCGPQNTVEAPLVDSRHRPIILTEATSAALSERSSWDPLRTWVAVYQEQWRSQHPA